jgi:predicted small lipoprotein YifL
MTLIMRLPLKTLTLVALLAAAGCGQKAETAAPAAADAGAV